MEYRRNGDKMETTVSVSNRHNKKSSKLWKALKITAIVISSIIMLLVLAFVGIRVIYPSILRAVNHIEAPGIDVMETVEIGGISQVLYFRGEDIDNPVILFLHGGPGSANIPFIHNYQYEWEEYYTVVQWEQRNSGKTYFANDPDAVLETMNAQQVLQDAHEVTQYIKQRLDKDKIIVLGHSWGSALGTMLVQTYPEDYIAYIGTGQCVNMMDNERVGYEKVLEAARIAGNDEDIAALEALAPYPPEGYNERFIEKMEVLRSYQGKYNLGFAITPGTLFVLLASPYYSLGDAMYFVNVDHLHYQGDLMRFLMEDYNAEDYGLNYEVPVYYIMGENDWQTPYPLAREFFDRISAPDKVFYSIPDAGHMTPQIDNTAEFSRVLIDEIRPRLSD